MSSLMSISLPVIGFMTTYCYQLIEDKRLNIKRKTHWNKFKFPIMITLLIWLTISLLSTKNQSFIQLETDNQIEVYTNTAKF